MSKFFNSFLSVAISMPVCAMAESHMLELDPANFAEDSHIITNPWWPQKPGERMVYEGHTIDDEGEEVHHRFIDTVTDLSKMVGGVRVLVSIEEDIEDGEMIEQEIAFHAQDKDGNVWHLGQLREVYDEVELVGGRVWVVDTPAGAKAGIRMEADPQVDGEEYSQGFAPYPFSWTDSAEVIEMGVDVEVPAGTFSDVMIIAEHDEETDDGIFQTKYYAKDVGLVQIGYLGDDPSKEQLFLQEVIQLDAAGMDEARALALAIDGRGYFYNATTPAEQFGQ